jgi:hypothetical protein
MKEIRVLGVYINHRLEAAKQVQAILTKFGCSIKTRLGLHEVIDDMCSTSGLILLELTGDTNEALKLENELLKIEGVQVEKMIFRV